MHSQFKTLITLTGPSGAGKGTILKVLLERYAKLEMVPSYTTRAQREGEKPHPEGNYIFISARHFEDKIVNGERLEHNTYNGNKYGTSIDSIRDLHDGEIGITEVDVNGLDQIFKKLDHYKDLQLIPFFILPPNLSTLRMRLEGRGENSQSIARRIGIVQEELNFFAHFFNRFQGVVVNEKDGLEKAIESFVSQLKNHELMLE